MPKFIPHNGTKWCSLIFIEFDLLRHDILISRLEMLGINGTYLKWVNIYVLRSNSIHHIYIEPMRSTYKYNPPSVHSI